LLRTWKDDLMQILWRASSLLGSDNDKNGIRTVIYLICCALTVDMCTDFSLSSCYVIDMS
jgi:hypothetical protein